MIQDLFDIPAKVAQIDVQHDGMFVNSVSCREASRIAEGAAHAWQATIGRISIQERTSLRFMLVG